jgi:hypothetical protein
MGSQVQRVQRLIAFGFAWRALPVERDCGHEAHAPRRTRHSDRVRVRVGRVSPASTRRSSSSAWWSSRCAWRLKKDRSLAVRDFSAVPLSRTACFRFSSACRRIPRSPARSVADQLACATASSPGIGYGGKPIRRSIQPAESPASPLNTVTAHRWRRLRARSWRLNSSSRMSQPLFSSNERPSRRRVWCFHANRPATSATSPASSTWSPIQRLSETTRCPSGQAAMSTRVRMSVGLRMSGPGRHLSVVRSTFESPAM